MAENKVATIYETNNYDKFKFIEGNRPINHAKKIIDSIKSIGILWQPVLVNEKFEIIDGQGRFLAMKTLGKPIIYVVQPGLNIEHVRYLNQNSTNWVVDNYIHSYAVGADAKDNYRNLEEIRKQFKEFSHQTILKAASKYGLYAYRASNIKDGSYEGMDFASMNTAIDRLTKLREIAKYIPESLRYRTKLLHGIIFCEYLAETDANFSIDQLFESIKKNYLMVAPARNIGGAIENLDAMYNHKRLKKNRYSIIRAYEDTLYEIRSASGAANIQIFVQQR